MSGIIYINEIHPNPETGSEWIELSTSDTTNSNLNLSNYTIFDNYHQIYKFTNEQFDNQLLVIEVSGLNNDKDSVILKNDGGEILDSFQYEQTQKGLSFARDQVNNNFTVEPASKNQINLITTLTPSPSAELTPITTLTPTILETSQPVIEKSTSAEQSKNTLSLPTTIKSDQESSLNQNTKTKYHSYDLNQIKLKTEDKIFTDRLTRLVFLGTNQGQEEIINAIIGSSLVILSSLFLIYAKFKRQNN